MLVRGAKRGAISGRHRATRAAGMSISGIRTAYDEDEVAEVTRLTGARPARRPAETP
jgi:hypothetical protein